MHTTNSGCRKLFRNQEKSGAPIIWLFRKMKSWTPSISSTSTTKSCSWFDASWRTFNTFFGSDPISYWAPGRMFLWPMWAVIVLWISVSNSCQCQRSVRGYARSVVLAELWRSSHIIPVGLWDKSGSVVIMREGMNGRQNGGKGRTTGSRLTKIYWCFVVINYSPLHSQFTHTSNDYRPLPAV